MKAPKKLYLASAKSKKSWNGREKQAKLHSTFHDKPNLTCSFYSLEKGLDIDLGEKDL